MRTQPYITGQGVHDVTSPGQLPHSRPHIIEQAPPQSGPVKGLQPGVGVGLGGTGFLNTDTGNVQQPIRQLNSPMVAAPQGPEVLINVPADQGPEVLINVPADQGTIVNAASGGQSGGSPSGSGGGQGSADQPRLIGDSGFRFIAGSDGTIIADAGPAMKPGSTGGPTAGEVFRDPVKDQVVEDNPHTCVYCRMYAKRPRIDHIIPRTQGGNATIANAQTTCQWCNNSKHNFLVPRNPPPWYQGDWPPPWWAYYGIK
jgi:hypothetical protein